MLLPVLLVLVLAQSLLAVTALASGAAARLSGDRRAAVEAVAALETATAHARVDHRGTLDTLSAGTAVSLPVAEPAGWTITATARREFASPLIVLRVAVVRRAADGTPLAGRRGTLLLEAITADTAIVIGSRPRF